MRESTKSESSFGGKVIKGGFWVATLRIGERVFQIVRIIVLARLLSPNDFGLFGIALLALSCMETFSRIGFEQAFIQKKGDTKPYLNTTWTVQIIRGLLIALILFFIAPSVAVFFKTPASEPILRVIGLSIIFQSLTNVAAFYFEKELKFHKYFIYRFAGTIVDVVVTISAAFILRSVWALIFGLLAGNLVRCIASYAIHPYRPRLEWDFPKVKEFFGFGKWILGSSVLIFLLSHGDDVFIGKFLGATMLGFYQMAFKISNMPATEITHVISRVTFPAYSKLQDNTAKLREAYLKVLQLTALFSVPLAGMLFVLAPDFTKIFLGEKWMPMVPAMQIFCILGAIRSIVATMGPIFYSTRTLKIQTQLSTMQLFIMFTLIYPLTLKWGIAGASLAVVLNNLADPWGFKKMFNIIKCRFQDFCKSLLLPIGGSFFMCLFLHIVKNLLGVSIVNFFLLVIIGVSVYFMFVYFLDGKINNGRLKTEIRWALRTVKAKVSEQT